MLENTQFATENAECSSIPLSQGFAAIEIERQQVARLIADFRKRLRVERQTRSLQSLSSFWPVAVGILLGVYAPFLGDLTANSAPWASTLLFPFSALMGEPGLHLSSNTAQSLAQFLLYAQFPLEGLLVRIILKHRTGFFEVFGRVTCLHIFALLYLVLVSGSLNQFVAS
jgi:hypothetical protein